MRKITHVPIQTWKGWNPSDLIGIQDPDRDNDSCLGNMFNSALLVPLVLRSIKTIRGGPIERKTAPM
jgi:hypothetical protein